MAPRNVGIEPDDYVAVPAGLTASKENRHLAFLETVEIPTQCNVSASGSIGVQQPEFEPLEHSVYLGRERLGRYSCIGPKLYAAFDAKDRLLGKFKRRKEAYAAVSIAHSAGNGNAPSAKRDRR